MMTERERRFPAPRRGQLGFVLALLAFVAFLLANITTQTKWAANTQLFTQPRFWPAVGLGMMAIFGLLYWRSLPWKRFNRLDRREAIRWAKAIEFVCWFMAYVMIVPRLGYLPSTLIFVPLLGWRMGYRRRSMLWVCCGFAFATVVIFKSFLAVKIPGGAIYQHLPDALRSFFLVNF